MKPIFLTQLVAWAALCSLGSTAVDAQQEFLPFGSDWRWLHPDDGTDPATIDEDFETTWFDPESYDGPAFEGPSAGLLGYGSINFADVVTDLGRPESGNRYSAYFVTEFNLDSDESSVSAEILADDSAVIYVDGQIVGAINFDESKADSYFELADRPGLEDVATELSLGEISAGEHTIAVSVHNQSPTSSDLGFDLRLFRTAATPENDDLAGRIVLPGDPFADPITITGSTIFATKEADERAHGFNRGGASIWFEWTAPASGPLRIDTSGSDFDTTLGVYVAAGEDPSQADLFLINSSDDGDGSRGSGVPGFLSILAQKGMTYYIAVDGFADADDPAGWGAVELVLEAAPAPPANDNFANAEDLGSDFPQSVTGSNQTATKEMDEAFHGRFVGFSSVWFRWTAPANERVEINTIGSSFTSLLAVYTGTEFDDLREVASEADFGFSSVTFTVEADTTYFIAVDGSLVGKTLNVGDFRLNIRVASQLIVLPFGSEWSWLHPLDGRNPARVDVDFDTTWFDPESYDGPAFEPPAPGLLGFGFIGFAPVVTEIGLPDEGDRHAAYFRRQFNVAGGLSGGLIAEVLADDGAVIYVDGAEAGRINFSAPTDTYFELTDAVGLENETVAVRLGDLSEGDHAIAVSIHNQADDSSDLGFDMQIVKVMPSFGEVALVADGQVWTGFEDPAAGVLSYVGRSEGEEVGWTSNGIPVMDFDGEQALEISRAIGASIVTEAVDVRQTTNVVASVDVRTFDESSGFEESDNLRVFVEGSVDGVSYEQVINLVPSTEGGSDLDPPDDDLIELGQDGGYTTFISSPGAIADTFQSLRVVVRATANSPSEHIVIDNICFFGMGAGVDRDGDGLSDSEETSVWFTNPNNPDTDGDGQADGFEVQAGSNPADPSSMFLIRKIAADAEGLEITFSGGAGKTYRVETSPDLSPGNWTNLDEVTAEGATAVFRLDGGQADPRAFFRVSAVSE